MHPEVARRLAVAHHADLMEQAERARRVRQLRRTRAFTTHPSHTSRSGTQHVLAGVALVVAQGLVGLRRGALRGQAASELRRASVAVAPDSSQSRQVGLRRLLAWLVDCVCILVWVAVTAAVGIPLYLSGVIDAASAVALNIIGAGLVVAPAVAWLAWCESSRHAATPGKRVMGLAMEGVDAEVRYRTALARNTLKVGAPWVIGHSAVFAMRSDFSATGPASVALWVLVAAAYVMPLIWATSLFVGSGRTPYDRASGTRVVNRSTELGDSW